MCGGGNKAPSAPVLPPPPPPKEMQGFFNQISGTRYGKKSFPDGREEWGVIRDPRSPGQQAFFELAENALASSMKNIQELYRYDPSLIPSYEPFIDTISGLDQQQVHDLSEVASLRGFGEEVQKFKDMSKNLIEDRHYQQKQALESSLAKRGLSNSTIGTMERQALEAQQNLTAQQAEVNAMNWSQDYARKQQDNQLVGYKERQAARDKQANTAALEYNTALGDFATKENYRKGAMQEQAGILGHAENAINQDYQRAMGGNVEQHALQNYNAQNQVQLAHHNANQQRTLQNYNMQLSQFQNQPPSFGDTALKLGATAAATYFGGPMGGMAAYGAMNSLGGSSGGGNQSAGGLNSQPLPSGYQGFGDYGQNAITNTGLVPGRIYHH